jgi:hypothetical protein
MVRQQSLERLVSLFALAYIGFRVAGSRASNQASPKAAINASLERGDQDAMDTGQYATFTSDLARLLTTSTLDYLKSTAHGVQTLAGLLLTAYIALFVAFGKEYGFFELSPLVTGLPIGCFGLSLLISIIQAIAYRGDNFEFGDLESTLSAYEKAVMVRKRQLLGPCAFTLLGIGSFALVIAEAV